MTGKKTEALKLALECIEAWDRGANASDYWRDRFDAITAIREALAEQQEQPKCNSHPKAPHGFDRNASHSADRYVCDCESWEPYDAGYQAGFEKGLMSLEDEQPAQQQEPVAWLYQYKPAGTRFVTLEMASAINHQQVRETPLYTSPPASKTWVGLTDEEIIDVIHPLVMADMADEATDYEISRAIEAKLKEKNA